VGLLAIHPQSVAMTEWDDAEARDVSLARHSDRRAAVMRLARQRDRRDWPVYRVEVATDFGPFVGQGSSRCRAAVVTAEPDQLATVAEQKRYHGSGRPIGGFRHTIDTFVLGYDTTDARHYRWTYDGTPLKAV
jgi:hypothetical protein